MDELQLGVRRWWWLLAACKVDGTGGGNGPHFEEALLQLDGRRGARGQWPYRRCCSALLLKREGRWNRERRQLRCFPSVCCSLHRSCCCYRLLNRQRAREMGRYWDTSNREQRPEVGSHMVVRWWQCGDDQWSCERGQEKLYKSERVWREWEEGFTR